jgi:hypothetical protein
MSHGIRSHSRSRGLSEHGAFSCEEPCISAHMQGWGYQLEEEFGKKCQRWVVTRDSAWRCEHDDYNIAVFKRTLLSILHSNREQITSSDAKFAWFNLTPWTWAPTAWTYSPAQSRLVKGSMKRLVLENRRQASVRGRCTTVQGRIL